ncbi:hypothetical protein [Alsobacter sp. R-9]
MRHLALSAAAAIALAVASPALAGPERMPAEAWTQPYSGSQSAIPACADPSVLSRIQSRFSERESSYWNSNLTIVGFDKIRPTSFRPWGLDFIPRLFCTGVATTSDGKHRQIDYSIGESTGIIGWGWGVEWCVSGLDRQLGFPPNCRTARP